MKEARQLIAARRKSTAVVLGNLALAGILRRDVDAATSYLHQAIEVSDALDNALMESTIGLYKTELITPRRPGLTRL
ncbi:hypothetical protein A6A27_26410 [Micromonospora sp. CB01531]|nr:hypothetical protein A6A27_26410 [Micromonospora sp. CB01531]